MSLVCDSLRPFDICLQTTGGILTLPGFETRFGIKDDQTLKGVIVGSYDAGCLLGALATFPVGGRIGRKRSILLGTTIMMLGAFLQFLAGGFGIMTAGRSVTSSIMLYYLLTKHTESSRALATV